MGSSSPTPPLKAAASINTTTANSKSNFDPEKSIEVVEVSSQRAQWLRAAVLGANDGLLSTASLMVGVGAVKSDVHTTLIAGLAGLLGGAFSMAAGEFVSVYSQYDIELSQIERERNNKHHHNNKTNHTTSRPKIFNNDEINTRGDVSPSPIHVINDDVVEMEYLRKKKDLPSPFKAAGASALAFAMGALVPLLMFLAVAKKGYGVRLGAVVAAVSVALGVFGWVGAVLGSSPPLKAALRVLIGGWVAMGVTFGLTKLVGSSGSGL